MKILLTGGSGMVGRNVAEQKPEWVKLWNFGSGLLDLLDYDSIYQHLRRYKYDLIIHAAGKVGGIQDNINEPYEYLYQNLAMGTNLIHAANMTGHNCLLNLGSSCMYPAGHEEPLHPNLILSSPLEPTNEGYALAKIAVQRLCLSLSRQCDRQYKTLIPCNLYGRWDKFGETNAHMVPAAIRKVLLAKQRKAAFVDIWGNGRARREFLYAGDFAKMLWKCVEEFSNLPDVMNIGTGVDYTVQEYYAKVCEAAGMDLLFRFDESKPEGMKRKLLDVSVSKELGVFVESSLEDGISETIKHFWKDYMEVDV